MDNNNKNDVISIDSEIIETVIGAGTKFKGGVKTDKTILIDGVFEGTIDSTALVIVSEVGKFKGTMNCRILQIYGQGEGQITCSELCKFSGKGKFSGDLVTKDLVTVEGSVLDGTIKMTPAKDEMRF